MSTKTKKLNLVSPVIKTGFLCNGYGQKVKYLGVNPALDEEKLKEDIEFGFDFLKDIESLSERNPAHFLVINCRNVEDGYMALSYIASMYNVKDVEKAREQIDLDEFPFIADFEEPEINSFEEYEEFRGGDEWENESSWTEDNYRIPIIDINEIRGVKCVKGTLVAPNFNVEKPYWYLTRREPVCIVNERAVYDIESTPDDIIDSLERFANNRHVYIVNVLGAGGLNVQEIEEISVEYDTIVVDAFMNYKERRSLYEKVMEYLMVENSVSFADINVKRKYMEYISTRINGNNNLERIEKLISKDCKL